MSANSRQDRKKIEEHLKNSRVWLGGLDYRKLRLTKDGKVVLMSREESWEKS